MKPFSGKVRQNVQRYLNPNLVIRSFLEYGFGATLSWKKNVLSVWKEHFSVFSNFSLKKLKPFLGEVRQRIQSYLNQSLVIGSFLENSFEAILSSKMSVVIVWKEQCSVLCKFLSDKVERISWESEARRWTLFISKFGHKSFVENGFEATLSWNTNVLSLWKEHFSVFCKFLSDEVETICWKSYAKPWRLFKSKFGPRKLLKKWFWS